MCYHKINNAFFKIYFNELNFLKQIVWQTQQYNDFSSPISSWVIILINNSKTSLPTKF